MWQHNGNGHFYQPHLSTKGWGGIHQELVRLLRTEALKLVIIGVMLEAFFPLDAGIMAVASGTAEPTFIKATMAEKSRRLLAIAIGSGHTASINVRLRATLTVNPRTSDWPLFQFSPDGQIVATGTGNEPVKLWDVKSGQLLTTLTVTGKQAPKAFSPDGRILATTGSGTGKLVNPATGELIARLEGEHDLVEFSPDGKTVLTYGLTNKARIWDVTSGRLRATIGNHKRCDFIEAIFSPDGRRIATACTGDKAAKLWDAATGQLRANLTHPSGAFSPLFTPDGQTVATASLDDAVRLWDAETGQLKATLRGHRGTIYQMALSPNGQLLATASRDGTAKLWDVATGKLKATLSGNDGIVLDVVFSPDGRTVAVLGEFKRHEAKLWDVETGRLKTTLDGHRKYIDVVSFSPDGHMLASASKDAVRVWSATTSELITVLERARYPVAFSPDGRTLATAGQNNTVLLWDVQVDQ